MRRLCVLGVLVLFGASSWAQSTVSGQWLHEGWVAVQHLKASTADSSDISAGSDFAAYVEHEALAMSVKGWLDTSRDTSQEGQWFDAVGAYLEAHPAQWDLDAEVLVYRALYAVWPGKTIPAP
jgi:hypothetical protein